MFRRRIVEPSNRSRRVARQLPMLEALESRQLLSVAPTITLPGTYDGNVHIEGGGKATAGNHAFALTLSSQSGGQLAGAMTVTGVGAYVFTGTLTGGRMTLYFNDAGPSAGKFVGRVNTDGSLITGRWTDVTGKRRISGAVRGTPGTTAASAPGVPSTVGTTSSSTTLSQQNVIAGYSGRAHMRGPDAFKLSISPYTITLHITNESDSGLVSGTLGLLNQTINFTGLVGGGQMSFVLTGPAAGEGSASVGSTARRISGSLVARFPAGPVRCSFVLYNPSAPKVGAAGTGSTGTAFNGSGLPGQPGNPTPITTLPTPGTGTGTTGTGLGTTGFIPPTGSTGP